MTSAFLSLMMALVGSNLSTPGSTIGPRRGDAGGVNGSDEFVLGKRYSQKNFSLEIASTYRASQ
jgi:hypothetical protein